MKNIKIFLTVALMMVAMSSYSQGVIFTVDGKMFWVNEKIDNFANLEDVSVEDGRRIIRIPISDIVSIEYMEQGLKILQPYKLKKVEPVAFDNNIDAFLASGKRVYIPLSSGIIQQRWGAKKLIELVNETDYWKIVGCEDEADFIMEYVFDDKGKDHAYLLFSDRLGKKILSSFSVGATDFVPVHAGEESAEKLFKGYIKKYIFEGKLSKIVKKDKKASKQ